MRGDYTFDTWRLSVGTLGRSAVSETKTGQSLSEQDAAASARLLGAVVVGPPLLPVARVVAEGLAGDYAQRAIDPTTRIRIQRIVIQKIQQIRNSSDALFARQHSRLRQAAPGALPNPRRTVMGEAVEQGIDGSVGAKH